MTYNSLLNSKKWPSDNPSVSATPSFLPTLKSQISSQKSKMSTDILNRELLILHSNNPFLTPEEYSIESRWFGTIWPLAWLTARARLAVEKRKKE